MNPPTIYKAKNLDGGNWLNGYYIRHSDFEKVKHFLVVNGTVGFSTHLIDFDTLCIYIGLIDKNQKEIASGDKLRGFIFNDKSEIIPVDGYVKYDNGCFKLNSAEFGYLPIAGLCDVIIDGNIFD